MRFPRLTPPPPLTDCCNPPTLLERILWKLRLLRPKVKVPEFRSFSIPVVAAQWPGLLADDICSAQPMTSTQKKP